MPASVLHAYIVDIDYNYIHDHDELMAIAEPYRVA